MSTTSPPCRGGARTAALAALTLAGSALLGSPALAAPPGDNGDVKIHQVGTLFTDRSNEPKVCDFYLAAFDFDPAEHVTWSIDPQSNGPGAGPGHLDGEITIATDGTA